MSTWKVFETDELYVLLMNFFLVPIFWPVLAVTKVRPRLLFFLLLHVIIPFPVVKGLEPFLHNAFAVFYILLLHPGWVRRRSPPETLVEEGEYPVSQAAHS